MVLLSDITTNFNFFDGTVVKFFGVIYHKGVCSGKRVFFTWTDGLTLRSS